MKFDTKNPPRQFEVGFDKKGIIYDCGTMHLRPDEQITFVTENGNEYDVTRKDWGFYAAPSLNGRLLQFNLRSVLVKNRIGRYFLLLVERGKENLFHRYIDDEKLEIVAWVDSSEALQAAEKKLSHD
jgi:hypothetical protein